MREQRKVVTILFCDLVGSTVLGESTDPEALRTRMRRYFEDLGTILERHGGSVEKFAGDAAKAGRAAAKSIEIRTAKGDVAGAAALGLEVR